MPQQTLKGNFLSLVNNVYYIFSYFNINPILFKINPYNWD